MKLRIILAVLALMSFLSALTIGYAYYFSLKKTTFQEAERQAVSIIETVKNRISLRLSENLKLAKVLAGYRDLQIVLEKLDQFTLTKANLILDHFHDSLDASVCYLMDHEGNTLASSNRNAPDSFVGKSYAFRPYFQQSLQGRPCVYMAQGVTSGERGIYCSYPVYAAGAKKISGVVAIKAPVKTLEEEFAQAYEGILLLTDPHGDVFLANRPEWRYNVLWKIPQAEISRIAQTRQFGMGPWQWTGLELVAADRARHNSGTPQNGYLIYRLEIDNQPGWKVIYLINLQSLYTKVLHPLSSVSGYAILTICILVGLAVYFLYNQASHDIVQRKKAEECLLKSEQRYRAIVEDQTELVCRFLLDGTLTFVNEACSRYFDKSRKELIGQNIMNCMVPLEHQRVQQCMGILKQAHINGCVEHPIQHSDGSWHWLQWTNRAILDDQGQALEIQSVGRDLTALKQAQEALHRANEELEQRVEARTAELARTNRRLQQEIFHRKEAEERIKTSLREKEALLKEIHHRVKNNLQIISSLLDMIGTRSRDHKTMELLADTRTKIQTMALIHMQLYQNDRFDQIDMQRHVQELSAHLVQVYAATGKTIDFCVAPSPVRLTINQAIPCALALNEIITNCVKHGFKNNERGKVEIDITEDVDRMIRLKIRDNGLGFPEYLNTDNVATLGLKLVSNLVQHQLKGEIHFLRDQGAAVTIRFKKRDPGEYDA